MPLPHDPDTQNIDRKIMMAENAQYRKYFLFENKKLVEERFFQKVDGKEIIAEEPETEKIHLYPDGFIDLMNSSGQQAIRFDIIEQFDLFPDLPLMVKSTEINEWKSAIAPLDKCQDGEKQKIKEAITENLKQNQLSDGRQIITIQQVSKTIELILENEIKEIPEAFYKKINSQEEFAIDRVVADKMYNLPRLLENPVLIHQGEMTYIIQAEIKDSYGNSLKLEHRLLSTSPEEADKIARLVLKRLKGIQIKIWMACWKMANSKGRYTYTCRLSELMHYCNPLREAHYNSEERLEFYEHLRSLENTKFVFTKSIPKTSKKNKSESFELRLLEIHRHSGYEGDKYPEEITMTILNTVAFQKQKTCFVGVGIKNRTMELHADDALLSSIIQTRKNQQMKANHLKFERDSLMNIAGLEKTNKGNSTQANKQLLGKLERLKAKGIIIDHPKRIKNLISLKVR